MMMGSAAVEKIVEFFNYIHLIILKNIVRNRSMSIIEIVSIQKGIIESSS